MPEGTITPAQYEIMEVIWAHGNAGATVAEIWHAVSAERPVVRTTVLNLVDRLEKRGWLGREHIAGVYRYTATASRDKTAALLASEFMDNFFGGSATSLVMSLLGSKRVKPADVERLRSLLRSYSPKDAKRKGKR